MNKSTKVERMKNSVKGANNQTIGNSFQKGWGQIQQKDVEKMRSKIMAALHIESRSMFHYRLNGSFNYKPSQREAVEKVFADYGITKIWSK